MDETVLTGYEAEIITNAELLLAKNSILKKVAGMFGRLAGEYSDYTKNQAMHLVNQMPPKISKGEQYLGLPYMVLDYPRMFGKQDTLAIRTLFWWGNHFSIHLLAAGSFAPPVQQSISSAIQKGELDQWYSCVGSSPWHHHFEAENYQPIKSGLVMSTGGFIKIAKKIPLSEWNNIEQLMLSNFKVLVALLTLQCGETVL